MSSSSEVEEVEEVDEEQLEVRFTTKLIDPSLHIPKTPFYVPTRLSRRGLSEVLNQLLGLDTLRPFDFMINETFLRCSLAKFIEKSHLKLEDTLDIEYTLVMNPPEKETEFHHDDWVSSVSGNGNGHIITGSYDNICRLWSIEGSCLGKMEGHTLPIKDVTWLLQEGKENKFVSASQDQTLRVWTVKEDSKVPRIKAESICTEHTGAVFAVSSSPTGDMFCSGGTDKIIRLWETQYENHTPVGKRRRTDESKESLPIKEQHVELTGCKGDITSLHWATTTSLFSGSWDRSIRQWDVESTINIVSLFGEKAVTSVSYSPTARLIISGHMDYTIRLWDPRTPDGKLVKNTFQSHTGLVSSVSFQPNSEKIFASASFDGSIKIWDIRSIIPLATLDSHTDKALCLSWDRISSDESDSTKSRLFSGGADNKLNIHQIATQIS